MSVKLRILFCYLAATVAIFALSDDSEKSFRSGIEAYEGGKYELATTKFNDALKINETAAARHNLGLTYFQMDRPAEAIWQLERALLLAPFNKNYREKLNATREQLGLMPITQKWYNVASQLLTPRNWMIIAVASFWLFLAAWILPRLGGFKKRPSVQFARLISLLVFALSLSALWLNSRMLQFGAILSDEATSLHAAPATAAPETGLVRPGERGRIIDQYNDFYQIESEGLTIGWISKDVFRPLVD